VVVEGTDRRTEVCLAEVKDKGLSARLNRPLKKSKKQIPSGLKAARDDKIKGLSARLKSCPDTKLAKTDFFNGLRSRALTQSPDP